MSCDALPHRYRRKASPSPPLALPPSPSHVCALLTAFGAAPDRSIFGIGGRTSERPVKKARGGNGAASVDGDGNEGESFVDSFAYALRNFERSNSMLNFER